MTLYPERPIIFVLDQSGAAPVSLSLFAGVLENCSAVAFPNGSSTAGQTGLRPFVTPVHAMNGHCRRMEARLRAR